MEATVAIDITINTTSALVTNVAKTGQNIFLKKLKNKTGPDTPFVGPKTIC